MFRNYQTFRQIITNNSSSNPGIKKEYAMQGYDANNIVLIKTPKVKFIVLLHRIGTIISSPHPSQGLNIQRKEGYRRVSLARFSKHNMPTKLSSDNYHP